MSNDRPTRSPFEVSLGANTSADAQHQAGNALRADAYKDSVGFILTQDGKKPDGTDATTGGTGFFVNKDGLMATDFHVIQDTKGAITVRTADGTVHQAKIVGVDTSHDLALLQVQPTRSGETFIPVDLATSSADVKPGDQLVTRGHPHRSEQSIMSTGSNNQKVPLGKFDVTDGLLPGESPNRTVITTDMDRGTVQSGDSGSPLFRKSDGKVVGIVDFSAEKTNQAISTPVEDLLALIDKTQRTMNAGNMTSPEFRIQGLNARTVPYTSLQNIFRWNQNQPVQAMEFYTGTDTTTRPVNNSSSTISTFANIRTLPNR
jgi:S1-C subfamily serine protease